MKYSRRNFISLIGASAIAGKLSARPVYEDLQDSTFNKHGTKDSENHVNTPNSLTLPPALKKGSKIAITAPASPTSLWELRHSIKMLNQLGCKVEVGNTITKRESKYKYLSASDEERAEEFMNYIERKDIDCILCGRGGYGVMRILPMLDFKVIKDNPKIVVGFSDITALVNAIYRIAGIVAFHGPVAVSSFDQFTTENFKKVLFYPPKFKQFTIKHSSIQTINNGTAQGKIVGGNLSMIASTLGTPYEVDTRGSILFIEEVEEHPYKIDRMLTQLWLSGKFDDCNGIAIGFFKSLNTSRPFFPGGSFTIKQVIEQRIKPIEKPAVFGMPFGHNSSNLTLPLGIHAELNATKKTFSILEESVLCS